MHRYGSATIAVRLGWVTDRWVPQGDPLLWSILNGTLVNTATVAIGSLAGLSIASRLPERYRHIVLNALGLVTITLGVDAAVLRFADTVKHFAPLVHAERTYGARLAMVMIASLIIGAVIGGVTGGAKDAAIGSAVGAGAGTVLVLATKGDEIELDPGRKEGETGARQVLAAFAHKHGLKFLS